MSNPAKAAKAWTPARRWHCPVKYSDERLSNMFQNVLKIKTDSTLLCSVQKLHLQVTHVRRTFLSLASVLLAMLFGMAASMSTILADETQSKKIANLVQPYIESKTVVGMTVGVVQKGKTIVRGFGQLSANDPRVSDGSTIYEIGSISKTFTGILLADAVVQKKVRLDQSVQELLPTGVTMPTSGDRAITLQHLATHVSGLPRLPDNFRPSNPEDPYADYTIEQLMAFLSSHKPTRPPATQFEYSNLAAGLLGWLLSNQANTSYEILLRARLTGPLELSDTVVELNADLQARLAPPHRADGTATVPWHIESLAGLGGIHSTVNDMLRYVEANLTPPSNDLGKAIELAWKIHQPPLAKENFAMGLGWHVARDGNTRWHTGGTGGFRSAVFIDRRSQTGVVVLANTASGEVDQLAEQIIQVMFGMKVEPRRFEKRLAVAPEMMKRYVGKYQLAPNFVFTVSTQDDKLMVALTGQPTFEVFPRSESEWFYKVVEATITFKVDDQGRCDELELFQNGVRQKAKRVGIGMNRNE